MRWDGVVDRAHDGARTALLVHEHVVLIAKNHGVTASRAMSSRGKEVAHRPARYEKPRFFPEELGHSPFELIDRGILAENVIPNLRLCHRLTHTWCRQSKRVRPKI
jgi:hypothetical protein